jgi:hypothetical protein
MSQQPGPYGQQQPYPDQQPFQQDPPQHPAGPPPRRTGLWAALTVAAVAVIAFAVTAFAWPGFLTGDDQPASAASCAEPAGGSAPDAYAGALVACINAHDEPTLQALTCGGNSETRNLIGRLDRLSGAMVTELQIRSDTEARAVIAFDRDPARPAFQAVLRKEDDRWCWRGMDSATAGGGDGGGGGTAAPPTTDPSSVGNPPAAAEAVLTDFLNEINAGDVQGATTMLCPNGHSLQIRIADVAAESPDLRLDTRDATVTEHSVHSDIAGSIDGKRARGGVAAGKRGGRWCVSGFTPTWF